MKKIAGILALAGVLIVVGLLTDRATGPGRQRAQVEQHYEKGMEHLFAFQYRQAEEELSAALELDPDFAMAATALADLNSRLGRREAYEELLARADSLAQNVENRRERILVQLWLSNHLDSRFRAEQDSLLAIAQETDPTHLIVMHTLAGRSDRSGDPEETKRLWQEILEAHPNYANAYNMLGYLALNNGQYEDAISYMRKYAFLAPELANPHDSLGEVLMTVGRYEEAEEQFKKALAKQPDFFYSLMNLGQIYIARGQLEKGVDVLERIRSEMEGTEIARRIDERLVETYYTNRLMDELDTATARFITEYPETHASAFYRAMRLNMTGRPETALAVLDSAAAVWRELPAYEHYPRFRISMEAGRNRFLALAAEERADLESAVTHWRNVLSTEAEFAPHHLFYDRERYAGTLVALGRYDAALDQLEKILAINPRLMRSLVLTIQAHFGLGQSREAERHLERLEDALEVADRDYPVRADYAALRERLN